MNMDLTDLYQKALGFHFLTPEEGDLVRRRFGVERESDVVGVGVDLVAQGNGERFRSEFGL